MSSELGHDIAISVDRVSKCYQLYDRPQHRLWQALWRHRRRYYHSFWALRDVSFQLRRGEALGIVGRNGAGKSTLLQIVAGTLTPSEGRVVVRSRIAAILQLGAGFHAEYTGRQNAYLNGAILGLSRRAIDERIDDIEAFADIGAYIDRPVKTYSKGMYARLAFAVAVAADPEIMIIDEVLTVGDLLFQQKCLTRIKQMQEQGLTLLFVSHSPGGVKGLCNRGLYLHKGRMEYFGSAAECIDLYLAGIRSDANREAAPSPSNRSISAAGTESPVIRRQTKGVIRYGTQDVRIVDVQILDDRGQPRREFRFGEGIHIEIRYRSDLETDDLNVSYLIRDDTGTDLTGTMTHDEGVDLAPVRPGGGGGVAFSFVNRLRPGNFGVSVAVTRINGEDPRRPLLFDQIDGAEAFAVLPEPKRRVHYKFDSQVEVKVL